MLDWLIIPLSFLLGYLRTGCHFDEALTLYNDSSVRSGLTEEEQDTFEKLLTRRTGICVSQGVTYAFFGLCLVLIVKGVT